MKVFRVAISTILVSLLDPSMIMMLPGCSADRDAADA
mgnify:CR=1 FL=1